MLCLLILKEGCLKLCKHVCVAITGNENGLRDKRYHLIMMEYKGGGLKRLK
jgi:hypothetical protein